jgi:hypothetical protein|tara:strand:+ start:1678 stop:2328 length:651 start_codon:yes stop_codon:yes gene_type:complete
MKQETSATKLLRNAMDEIMVKQDELSINLKGKKYLEIGPRIQIMRKHFGTRALINTEIVENTATRVVMRSSIFIDDKLVATGTAEEFRAIGPVNKTSALENCETSCIGRALGNLGLSNDKISSFEEVQQAMHDGELLKKSKQNHTGLALVREAVTYDSVIEQIENASQTESLKAVVSQPEIREFLKGLRDSNPKKMKAIDALYTKTQQTLTEGKTI